MKRFHVFASALLATLLLAVPAQSQAFFGFFGGGFGFGFGGGGGWWGGPGWWGSPGWWGGYPGWGGYRYWHRPWHYRPYGWAYRYRYPFWGGAYPFLPPIALPPVVTPKAAAAPETSTEK